jgi:uncharacterized protein YhhL (DUF1145 family)
MTENTKGNVLAAAAALLFFWLCIILPLVGRAARAQTHYWTNFLTFLLFLLPALACAHFARVIKLRQHRAGQGEYPWVATLLFGILSLLLVCLVTFRLDK